jgi:nucleoside-diphosphate-sugar epimerase
MTEKYLITGGAGFIGTNLSKYLLSEDNQVVVVDNLAGGKREQVHEGIEFHELDINDTDALTKVCEGVDVIFHLAALPRVQFSIEHPFEAQRANVDGTLSVLEAARVSGVRRVVFAASSSVYGDQEIMPLVETMESQPKSPYALHKLMGEHMLRLWSEIHGLETVSTRFFNVYGSHMDPDGAYALLIGKFLKMRKEGEVLTITGDGEQTRDFTHVDDVIDALMRAASSEKVGKGEVFNVGAGQATSVNRVAELIGGDMEYVAARHEPKHTEADNTKITEVLGWKPTVKLEDGITKLKEEWGIE